MLRPLPLHPMTVGGVGGDAMARDASSSGVRRVSRFPQEPRSSLLPKRRAPEEHDQWVYSKGETKAMVPKSRPRFDYAVPQVNWGTQLMTHG